jgi:hypothetical protein
MIWWAWLGHTNFSTRFDLGTRPLVFAAWSLVAVLVDAATRRIHRLPR